MYQREAHAIVTYEVERVNLREQVTAVIREKVGVEDPLRSFGDVYGEVCGHLARVGAQPIGPRFARYLSMNGALELEVGFPVRAAVPAAGRMETSRLPGGPGVQTTHVGAYERLRKAHEALEQWADRHDSETAGPAWEVYFTDPSEEPDMSKWRTQVVMPLRSRA